jgi:hypothetical protein
VEALGHRHRERGCSLGPSADQPPLEVAVGGCEFQDASSPESGFSGEEQSEFEGGSGCPEDGFEFNVGDGAFARSRSGGFWNGEDRSGWGADGAEGSPELRVPVAFASGAEVGPRFDDAGNVTRFDLGRVDVGAVLVDGAADVGRDVRERAEALRRSCLAAARA